MRTRLSRLAGAALLLAAACHEPSGGYRDWVPVARVVDLVPSGGPIQVARGVDATIGGETRRVVSTAARLEVQGLPEADAERGHYVAPIPPLVRMWRRANMVRTMVVENRVERSPVQRLRSTRNEMRIALEPNERLVRRTTITLRPADGDWPHDVTTAPFVVPRDAVLTFATAIDAVDVPTAMHAQLRVEHEDGSETIWQRTLDPDDAGWHEERVSLAAFGGRAIRLRFDCAPVDPARYGGPVVFGEPLVLVPRATPAPPPNVVLVSIDTLRARSVSAYGCPRPTSPTLDALAGDGVLFDNATSTATWTLPGHASMLTGLWLRTHGTASASSTVPADRPTLAEILQEAGYATAAFTAGGWVAPRFGFHRGFDTFSEHHVEPTPAGGEPETGFTRGLAWIRAHRDRPFFVFLHSYVVHSPHDAPAPYDRLFDEAPPPDAIDSESVLAYEREIRYADDQLAALLEALDALGLGERTLVVVTADHGEAFGEHGEHGHQGVGYDEVARIPLVMRLPGALPRGRVVTAPVSLADVMPTVLDVVGVTAPPDVDGTSLLPLATGSGDRIERDVVFTESSNMAGDIDLVAAHSASHTCLLRVGTGTECWNERSDPWQERPPVSDDDASAATTRRLLALFASRPSAIAGAPAGGVQLVHRGTDVVDVERESQLRSLGYLGD